MQSLILMLYSRWICLGKERIRRINNATFTIKNSLTQSLRSVKDTQCLSGISIPPRGGGVFFFLSSSPLAEHPPLWVGIHPHGWASTPMGGHFSFIQPSGRASTPMGGHPPPWVGITPLGWKGFGVYSDAGKKVGVYSDAEKKIGVNSDAGKKSASTQMQRNNRRLLRCRKKKGRRLLWCRKRVGVNSVRQHKYLWEE